MNNFKEVKIDSSQILQSNKYFTNNKPSDVILEYYDKDKCIGYIRYYLSTGQIGLFFIQKEYRNRGLGKQILSKVIIDLQENNCNECWIVTTKDHKFWSNIYNKSFTYREPVHESVIGGGYFINLKNQEYNTYNYQYNSEYPLYPFHMWNNSYNIPKYSSYSFQMVY
jgi:hypothetical protein